MATFRIPRLVPKTTKTGKTHWYWQPSATLRRQGHRPLALGTTATRDATPEILAAARTLNEKVDGGETPQVAAAIRRIRPPTLTEAIARFREAGYPSVKRPGATVAAGTRREYDQKFRMLEAWGGEFLLSSFTPERVRVLRDNLMKPAAGGRRQGEVRHHSAHATLRVGRTLFAWFEQEGLIPRGSNPFTSFGLAAPPPRDAIWWPEQRDPLLAEAAEDLGMAVAIDLAFSIGQREADLLKIQLRQFAEIPPYKLDPEIYEQLAEPDESGRRTVMGIRIRQGKTSRWVEVPVVGATRARVEAQVKAAMAAGVTTLLFDPATKRPWTMPNLAAGQARFIRRFAELRSDAIEAAKEADNEQLAADLAGLQFRDFRRTAVVHLGELGIADHLIAAITGHDLDETKHILETYMPRTTGMAARAIAQSQERGTLANRKVDNA